MEIEIVMEAMKPRGSWIGVDLIPSKDREKERPYVLEVNTQPGTVGYNTIIKGDILKDQLLHIKSINIDEIDIGSLVFDGVYTPIYPEPWATQQRQQGMELPETFKNTTQMGHNGTWTFKFTSPFYMWLLENLY